MGKKQGCKLTISLSKPENKNEIESAFLSPDNITPISGSGYKIIQSSMLQELILHQGVHLVKMEPYKQEAFVQTCSVKRCS